MSRLVVFLIILVAVIGGGLFLLAGRDSERPTTQVEKQVSLANLQ
ncbi:hypothetical protein Q5H91_04740 [Sphingomonas sp. KR1UV-12]|uniref:Uncharacterized protein n=1 Tax=Sphingomonas aurea TaxID=3063994 RepID=A0ABT9EHW6_9SPHN|nr:hypothetical protein [Sphingomonas sp. KR1UV-12]MDP1026509.1 hypothetical protein [Sphingomonas sp. KR1UV-12]